MRKENTVEFNRNPLEKIFGLNTASSAEIHAFWHELDVACGIKMPHNYKLNDSDDYDTELPLNNPDEVNNHARKVLQRLERFRSLSPSTKNAIARYTNALLEITALPSNWNAERGLVTSSSNAFVLRMKQSILEIIQRYKLTVGGAHSPQQIPFASAIYLRELANAPTRSFKKSLTFLVKQSACFEGTLQLATDKLL